MKRCPTCGKNYTDQNLSFCIDDGTPLVPATSEDEPVAGDYRSSDGKSPAYEPPHTYVPPGGSNKRKVWPWVLGILGVLVLGIVGVSIAAAFLLPAVMRTPANRNAATSNANVESNSNQRSDLNANSPAHNSTEAEKNINGASRADVDSDAPTGKEQVLAQLKDIENDWTVANINADKEKLDRILADDYVGTSSEGKTQGKAEYIKTINRDTQVQKWNFEDLNLSLRGDRATLSGTVRLQLKDREVAYHFTDKFVWRDGRWQATGSEVEPMQ
jgi:hypothetical protein